MEKIKINSETWVGIQMNLADVLLKDALADKRAVFKEQVPETIYHYTSLHGLIGIIESQSLFASNQYYLNDRKEYTHGVDLVVEVLGKLRQQGSHIEILDKIETSIHLLQKSERYITCFSLNGDLLSQWRAYGTHGKGIAIGFNRGIIEDGFFSQIVNSSMVLYDERDQKYNIETQVSLILNYFQELEGLIDWEDFDAEFLIAKVIIEFLEKTISIYKHPSFQDEKEYRLEYDLDGIINKTGDEKLYFKASENLIVPYIRLTSRYVEYLKEKKKSPVKIKPTGMAKLIPIDEIIIGPSLDFQVLKQSINKLLVNNGYKDVEVLESKVPYRI